MRNGYPTHSLLPFITTNRLSVRPVRKTVDKKDDIEFELYFTIHTNSTGSLKSNWAQFVKHSIKEKESARRCRRRNTFVKKTSHISLFCNLSTIYPSILLLPVRRPYLSF